MLPLRVSGTRAVVDSGLRLLVVSVVAAATEEDVVKIEPTDDGKYVDLFFHEERNADYREGRYATSQQFIAFDGWGRIRFSEEAWNELTTALLALVQQVEATADLSPPVRELLLARVRDVRVAFGLKDA